MFGSCFRMLAVILFQVIISLIIKNIFGTLSQMSPRCLQKALRIGGGGGEGADDMLSKILSNVPTHLYSHTISHTR